MTQIIPSRPLFRSVALLALAATPSLLVGQASFTGVDYNQNFDTLPIHSGTSSTTTTFNFNNNSTLVGWWSTVGAGTNQGRASSAAAAASGEIYSFGSSTDTETASSTDRALSIFTANGFAQTAHLGLQLRNDSGATIHSVTLSFNVEQWRRNTNAVTWDFSWLATSATGSQLDADGYTVVPAGNATSTVHGNAGGLSGNSNSTAISVTLTGLDWNAGEFLWLRWSTDQGSASAAIALDDVRVSLIPEPNTAAIGAGAVVLAFGLARRGGRQ